MYTYTARLRYIKRDIKLLFVIIALALSATNYSLVFAFYMTFFCLQLPTDNGG